MKIKSIELVNKIPQKQSFEIEIIGKSNHSDKIGAIYYLKIVYENLSKKYIKFHLLLDDDRLFNFIFIAETNTFFFEEFHYWGIIDLNLFKVLKYEKACIEIFMYKIKNSIIIDDEVSVYSYTKNGLLIQEGFTGGPPYKEIVRDNYIEFIQSTGERYQLKIE